MNFEMTWSRWKFCLGKFSFHSRQGKHK